MEGADSFGLDFGLIALVLFVLHQSHHQRSTISRRPPAASRDKVGKSCQLIATGWVKPTERDEVCNFDKPGWAIVPNAAYHLAQIHDKQRCASASEVADSGESLSARSS